ncbi:helix-turn-helix transcriptional regulator [Streptomyces diacarni]|uniref:helix-turn-helix domain-containing protein n=1 Tax=Streptomyces diacarni TaxID=2800381 RepID=UPI0033D585B5
MPTRQFSGALVRAKRRSIDISQDVVGERMGVGRGTVAKWETGTTVPDPHKLPLLAEVLDSPVDELFPREGEPDLADLRGDAGYAQVDAGSLIGMRSHIPVSKAERGIARLNDAYVEPLAVAYGVTVEELLAAQERSFGIVTPPKTAGKSHGVEQAPRTVAEKINYLLQNAYCGATPPTDAEIARAVNEHAGKALATENDIRALRTGTESLASSAMKDGLAYALKIDPVFFTDDAEVNPAAREVLEGIRFLGSIHQGQILGLAARGNQAGLSAEMIARVNSLVAELQDKLPDVQSDE